MWIKRGSTEKINGKAVKYKSGDCLSLLCSNGLYLGVFISDKFNKYYDLTLIEFYKKDLPSLSDFINGYFFGTRFGSWEKLNYGTDHRMISCDYIDNNIGIEKIGNINLTPNLSVASYAYIDTVDQLEDYYLEELPIRQEKSSNAEKFPDLAFVNKHLIPLKTIFR
jgi:hypothetical protein